VISVADEPHLFGASGFEVPLLVWTEKARGGVRSPIYGYFTSIPLKYFVLVGRQGEFILTTTSEQSIGVGGRGFKHQDLWFGCDPLSAINLKRNCMGFMPGR
jgi:hypothetical protein